MSFNDLWSYLDSTQLPQDIRKTNKRVSFSTGVIPTTSVSIPQLKSNQLEDRVMPNNSQGKKQEVEDHRKIQAVEKERKAKNILLMAIPKEHMRRFHGMDDAKEIWEAIRTRFGGNANSKKIQKAVFKQQFEAFKISSSEGLEKGYDRFQQLLFLTTVAVQYLARPLLLQNTNIPKEIPAGFADEVIYSLFAKQSEDWDLLHEDLEQIDDLDIEEIDINWQIAMIAIRMKKFYKKTGRRVHVDGKMHMLTLDKKT
ncbi:hypothetical protein Tco_1276301 [Tanacetum coccineum]